MTSTLLACDSYEDSIWLGWITEAGEEHLEEAESQEVALRRLTELSPSMKKIFVTDETCLTGVSLPATSRVSRRHRLEAIYWRFRDRVAEGQCLILSLTPRSCVAATVENGKVVGVQEGPTSLSLFGLWQAILKENRLLKRALDHHGQSEPAAFLAFLQALRGRPTSHPLVLIPPLNISEMAQASLDTWKKDLEGFLDRLDSRHKGKTLLCTDWAGLGAF